MKAVSEVNRFAVQAHLTFDESMVDTTHYYEDVCLNVVVDESGATLQITSLLSEICLIRFQGVAGISICLWAIPFQEMQLKASMQRYWERNSMRRRNLVSVPMMTSSTCSSRIRLRLNEVARVGFVLDCLSNVTRRDFDALI